MNTRSEHMGLRGQRQKHRYDSIKHENRALTSPFVRAVRSSAGGFLGAVGLQRGVGLVGGSTAR